MKKILFSGVNRDKIYDKPTYTKNDFEGYDNSLGIYFTNSQTLAKIFANAIVYDSKIGKYVETKKTKAIKAVHKVEINYNKPLIIEEKEFTKYTDSFQKFIALIKSVGGSKNLREKLLSEGYDCIILKNNVTNYHVENESYDLYILISNGENLKYKSLERTGY